MKSTLASEGEHNTIEIGGLEYYCFHILTQENKLSIKKCNQIAKSENTTAEDEVIVQINCITTNVTKH